MSWLDVRAALGRGISQKAKAKQHGQGHLTQKAFKLDFRVMAFQL